MKEAADKPGEMLKERHFTGQTGDNPPRLVATGQISRGVSVTYIPFQSMPGAEEIATTAVRKVVRALKSADADAEGAGLKVL